MWFTWDKNQESLSNDAFRNILIGIIIDAIDDKNLFQQVEEASYFMHKYH